MIQNEMRRTRSDLLRQNLRRRRRKSPGCREFGGEEYGAAQLDAGQDLREGIHSVNRTACNILRFPSNGISFGRPLEQVMTTLGHGRFGSRIVPSRTWLSMTTSAAQEGFFAMALGGPNAYTGRSLHVAHVRTRQRGVNEEDFDP